MRKTDGDEREECDEMIAACRANGVKMGVAYYCHFYPVVDSIKKLMQSGEIGKSVLVQINIASGDGVLVPCRSERVDQCVGAGKSIRAGVSEEPVVEEQGLVSEMVQ